jgi:hypothetical protein
MPVYPGGSRLGLGLWNSVALTVSVEVPLYLAGVWLYLGATRPRDGIGRWGFVLLVSTLLLIYVGDVLSPDVPPSVGALTVVVAIGGALFTGWSWWADRHRATVSAP